jgi:type IV pilus assembly protein PilY1
VLRAGLVKLTDLTLPVTLNLSTDRGWWIDLGTSAAGPGWRVITDASSFYGVVTFAAMVPSGSVCNPSGTSRVYSIDAGSGQSQLLASDGSVISYSTALAGVVNEHRTLSVNGTGRLFASNDNGETRVLKRKPPANAGLRRLNWRELPLAD